MAERKGEEDRLRMEHDGGGCVLLVDDAPASRQRRAASLSNVGWTVFEAATAGVAARVRECRPDVLVCDSAVWPGVEADVVTVVVSPSPIDDERLFDVVDAGADSSTLVAAVARAAKYAAVLDDNRRLTQELARAQLALRDRDCELQRQSLKRAVAEDALCLARDHAMAASYAKSAFLTNMSHELRTPLNAMLGYAELMSETVDDPGVSADVGRIAVAGRHLLGLIDDVLGFARVESGHASLAVGEVDAESLLDAVRHDVLILCESRGLLVEVEPSVEPVGVFPGDADAIGQCLRQLVDNAIKFTDKGGIFLSVHKDDEEVSFVVRDTGCGIATRDQAAIFGAFYRGDSPDRYRAGPGLGLAIARRLCDLMGARMSVSSEVGRGSTFTLTLPVWDVDSEGRPWPS